MSSPRRRRRLLAPAAVALLALAGVSCSDDGDDDASPSTEAPPSTDGGGSTTEDAETTPTTGGDDGTSTTTEGEADEQGDLASRIPDIGGYERESEDDDDDGFDDELCDGSSASVDPVEEVSADYVQAGVDDAEELLAIGAGRFASEDEASTFYQEFTATTAGCTTDDVTVDEGTDSGIGEEGRTFGITFPSSGGGTLYVSMWGDEVWFLSHLSAAADVPPAVVDAFRVAVEG